MAKLLMKNENTGMERNVKKGFSWTILFFGGFALIFRGQVKQLIIWLVLLCLLFIPGFIYGIYLAFNGNKELIDQLGQQGYKVVNT